LELLISGLPEIDVDDLRGNTDYHGYQVNDPVINYFWNVVKSLSKEDKAQLIQFITGSSKVSQTLFGFLFLILSFSFSFLRFL
jgi:E3 ubiquitin-protein ligase HUWE1